MTTTTTTIILPESASLLGGVKRPGERQDIIDAAVAEAAAKIEAEGYEFATGALGNHVAAERTFLGGVALYTLTSGEQRGKAFLTAEQARGLRDYLNSIDIEG